MQSWQFSNVRRFKLHLLAIRNGSESENTSVSLSNVFLVRRMMWDRLNRRNQLKVVVADSWRYSALHNNWHNSGDFFYNPNEFLNALELPGVFFFFTWQFGGISSESTGCNSSPNRQFLAKWDEKSFATKRYFYIQNW